MTMLDDEIETTDRQHRVRALLLDHLFAAGLPEWPGADGLTVYEVVLTYPAYAAAGRVPGLPVLVQGHPDLREELYAFFAANVC